MKSSVEKQLIKALINSINRITTFKRHWGNYSGISEMDVLEILRILGVTKLAHADRIVPTLDVPIKEIISSHTNLMNMYGFSIKSGDPYYNDNMLAYEYSGEWHLE